MERLEYPAVLGFAAAGAHDALFALLAERLKASVGFELLTVLVADPSERQLRRIFSTDETAYPLGLADKVEPSAWFEQLFTRREPIVANNRREIALWLPDYDGFEGTDLGSLLNCPIVAADRTIAILNLTDRPGQYGPEAPVRVAPETALCAMAVSTYLSGNENSRQD
ncbi:GAF domain-containing protein [Nitratireductor sp. XY-223]|uniref:GAF domain-containing protein n=1 Tax=Nitratireductor sp. XY-223 TaxID=2561926 RepID=UPI0010A9E2B1|nr:GAF domain-containing protein [Nitratireductor sp. XY-223]